MAVMFPNHFRMVKIVVGVIGGLILSLLPFTAFLFLCVLLLIVFFIRMRTAGWRHDAITLVAVVIVLIVCYLLPTKQLDAMVGPMAYHDVTLGELCDRLYQDHGIICHVYDEPGRTCRLSFWTSQPLSQRNILEKLSRETGRSLHIGFCGTNATILFGAYPSFTYLGEGRHSEGREIGAMNGGRDGNANGP